jgi:hypothetical protein
MKNGEYERSMVGGLIEGRGLRLGGGNIYMYDGGTLQAAARRIRHVNRAGIKLGSGLETLQG